MAKRAIFFLLGQEESSVDTSRPVKDKDSLVPGQIIVDGFSEDRDESRDPKTQVTGDDDLFPESKDLLSLLFSPSDQATLRSEIRSGAVGPGGLSRRKSLCTQSN